MKRRVFVGGAISGTALAAAQTSNLKPAVKTTGGGIPKRKFGKTGVELTIIGQAGGRFPLCTFDEAVAITRRAYDLGINYFDNAHAYWDGRSEEVYGAALQSVRKDVFLTSKALDRTRDGARKQLEESLKRMKTDHLDLWQIHAIGEMEEVEKIFAPGGAIEAFEAAKKEGLCRFIGFTGHRDPAVHAEMMKRYKNFDTILMPLHIADTGYLSFERGALREANKQQLGIQAMKTTANAKLLQAFSVRECIRYALSLQVHTAAMGCTTIGQLEDDVRIAREFEPLSDTAMSAMRQRADRIKGPDLEDWKRNTERASLHAYVGG
ncbi:MAG TPA: aldo/keto reductase [Bryobacteraceae bacterium]|nr:aldo/keto reductase [Bryobacteraceae bacterium]